MSLDVGPEVKLHGLPLNSDVVFCQTQLVRYIPELLAGIRVCERQCIARIPRPDDVFVEVEHLHCLQTKSRKIYQRL